jgi:heptosyltransferase III
MPPALLVVHPGALGDVVLVFGLMRELRRGFRPVALLAQSEVARLAAAEGLADDAFALESAWTASVFGGRPDLQARNRLSPYSHALAFSSAPALADGLRMIARGGVCTVPPRPPAGLPLHAAEYAWTRVTACGLLPADAIPLPPPQRTAIVGPQSPVLIHPGAGSPRKRWPIERFHAVAAAAAAGGANVEYVLGPADHDLQARLPGSPRLHLPADTLALRRLLLSARAYIGNDSGVSHLAAWLGLPCVVVFGPSDPVRWRPPGEKVEVVRPPLACTPCFETSPANCEPPDCLLGVSPEEVVNALGRVLSAGSGGNRCMD